MTITFQTDVGRDYLAAQAGSEAGSPVTLPTPRRAHCWHLWRAQHSHAGLTRWRCRGCCGCALNTDPSP